MAPRPRPLTLRAIDDDRDAFARIRAGDAEALREVFDRYADQLCSFAFAYTKARDAAEDIVQELFVWLWEHRSAIEPPRSAPAYLFTAVRNRALNHLRGKTTELRIYEGEAPGERGRLAAPFAAPDALAEARDLNEALNRAVAALPLRCREVFTLSRARQLTYAEIAEILGLSSKTVEIHMSRALAELRDRLQPWLRG